MRRCVIFAFAFSFLTATLAVTLPRMPTVLTANDAVLSAISDDIARKLEIEYMAYLKTGIESAALRQISQQLAKSHSKKDIFVKEVHELGPVDQFFVCTSCRAFVNVIARSFRAEDGEMAGPNSREIAKKIVLDICRRLQLQTDEVCLGLFESNWDSVEYIIKNTVIDSREMCGLFMQMSFCNVGQHPDYEWSLDIDSKNDVVNGSKSDNPIKTTEDLRILHLTDIHHDPLYVPGSLAECEEPMCCQRHKDIAEGTTKAAGHWGDYRECDLPWHTVENAFSHIRANHKIDYIYQTGDVIDHTVWATSPEFNTEMYRKITSQLSDKFPGIPIYPAIGNHEPHPLNLFSPDYVPDYINTKWLYRFLFSVWSKYLPPETEETILKGGYYTVLVRPGFRIITLNNNDCYTDNWWLFFNGTDMKTQLMWLHDVLLDAENANEFVHILAHIPSGDGTCWYVWAREYNRIIARFRNTISGIFNGHTHKDEMNVHYSNQHAVAVSWNAGSLTTYAYKNPNYRIYEVEPKSYQVVDHETWIFNLTDANSGGESKTPEWFKEYTFSEEFTGDLSPGAMDKYLDIMSNNPELVRKFWRYKVTTADPALTDGCDKNCLLATLCRIATTVNNQKSRCEVLKAQLSTALDNENNSTEGTTTTELSSTTSSGSTSSSSTESTTDPTTGTTPGKADGAVAISAVTWTSLLVWLAATRVLL